jgi:hypothetical protein
MPRVTNYTVVTPLRQFVEWSSAANHNKGVISVGSRHIVDRTILLIIKPRKCNCGLFTTVSTSRCCCANSNRSNFQNVCVTRRLCLSNPSNTGRRRLWAKHTSQHIHDLITGPDCHRLLHMLHRQFGNAKIVDLCHGNSHLLELIPITGSTFKKLAQQLRQGHKAA